MRPLIVCRILVLLSATILLNACDNPISRYVNSPQYQESERRWIEIDKHNDGYTCMRC
jgi:hypothetical protein